MRNIRKCLEIWTQNVKRIGGNVFPPHCRFKSTTVGIVCLCVCTHSQLVKWGKHNCHTDALPSHPSLCGRHTWGYDTVWCQQFPLDEFCRLRCHTAIIVCVCVQVWMLLLFWSVQRRCFTLHWHCSMYTSVLGDLHTLYPEMPTHTSQSSLIR